MKEDEKDFYMTGLITLSLFTACIALAVCLLIYHRVRDLENKEIKIRVVYEEPVKIEPGDNEIIMSIGNSFDGTNKRSDNDDK